MALVGVVFGQTLVDPVGLSVLFLIPESHYGNCPQSVPRWLSLTGGRSGRQASGEVFSLNKTINKIALRERKAMVH